ncbi:MAG TPA: DUF5947 family protein [Acidimicrobiales bacterium]|nr:DUF5947 family protein [Acidimicrobiales bacterium]
MSADNLTAADTTAPAALDVLQRIATGRPRPRPGETCDLCGEPVPDEHSHIADLRNRSIMCGCRACYLLFTHDGAGAGHLRAVPDRYEEVRDFTLGTGGWDALQIPVGVAFFFFNSDAGHITAFYPGPAGAAESLLRLDAWKAVVDKHPQLTTLAPDVEAVLVRVGGTRRTDEVEPEAYVVPIDACYELVGLLRMHWRGFDGGEETDQAIDHFFARVRGKAGIAEP